MAARLVENDAGCWDSSGRKATKAGPTKRHLSTRDASGRDFLPALQLDFSHCAAYQSASIKCFIRAMGLFAGPCSRATRKSLSVSLRLPPAHEEWVKRQRRHPA